MATCGQLKCPYMEICRFWKIICLRQYKLWYGPFSCHTHRCWDFQRWILKIHRKLRNFIWYSKLKLKPQIESSNIKLKVKDRILNFVQGHNVTTRFTLFDSERIFNILYHELDPVETGGTMWLALLSSTRTVGSRLIKLSDFFLIIQSIVWNYFQLTVPRALPWQRFI